MKVLYLWNTAGVFTPVAEWLIANGHESKIVMRSEFDIYEQTSISDAAVMVGSSRDFIKKSISMIRSWNPDIIHISGTLRTLILARLTAPRSTIVFSYHGSDARNPEKKAHRETKLADFVHVTTPDLKPYGTWIDRPIPSIFTDRGGRVPGTALMFYKSHFYVDNRDLARAWCKNREYDLTILDEEHSDFPIPNVEMPELFSKFEFYLDWKDQKGELEALSKTALEALSCGCKVVHDSDLEHVFEKSDVFWVKPIDYFNLYLEIKDKRTAFTAIRFVPRTLYYAARLVLRILWSRIRK